MKEQMVQFLSETQCRKKKKKVEHFMKLDRIEMSVVRQICGFKTVYSER